MNVHDFLKNGTLMGLSINDTEASLLQKFDKETLGEKLYPDSTYKDVYYYYAFGGVLEICVMFGNVSHFNVTSHQDFFFLEYGQNKLLLSEFGDFHEFTALLDELNIEWHFLRRYCRQRNLAIITESNVVVFFDYSLPIRNRDLIELQVNENDTFEASDKVNV